jgi:3-(3-hydroxy-phenyl)propionate hydroxylase
VCPDAPVSDRGEPRFLLEKLGGAFKLLAIGNVDPSSCGLEIVRVGGGGLEDTNGLVAARLGTDVVYLVRPDQHIAARFAAPGRQDIAAALARAGLRQAMH